MYIVAFGQGACAVDRAIRSTQGSVSRGLGAERRRQNNGDVLERKERLRK